MFRNRAISHNKQRGMATLITSIILLVLITLVSFYMARSVLMEQKLVNNDIRSKQAFEAAEAGLSVAQEYFMKGIAENTAEGKYVLTDEDGDGSNDTFEGNLGNTSFKVTLRAINVDGFIAMGISSIGTSADGSATKTIETNVVALNPIPNIPDNPISTKGAFVIGGSGTVHNAEGHSTIWSGGDIDIGSNNSTKTLIADPNDSGYPSCMDTPNSCDLMESSNREMAGLDVIEHDSDLANLTADEMFMNFFGMSPDAYKETMATRIVDTANPGESTGDCGNSWDGCANMAQSEVVWIEGDVNQNGASVGCAVRMTGNKACAEADERPSIVIINGDATFKGTPHFYGVLFVMGGLNGSGNMTMHGALITAGGANTGGGSLDAYYNSRLLENLQNIGPRAVSAGSWKDF
ncbi:PilX N-terminal domain-containing pilus assembly protein [Thalassotalea crassostreae]|uniref:pilus assembly PilX family protein n=1 Tax=Thalassotalea crassostreae TaxID=1763536 RepID=UPI0008391F95|nr:PilX N-terminal domain-containing pilus assembly protein [Thalassotalea crassostreae]